MWRNIDVERKADGFWVIAWNFSEDRARAGVFDGPHRTKAEAEARASAMREKQTIREGDRVSVPDGTEATVAYVVDPLGGYGPKSLVVLEGRADTYHAQDLTKLATQA